MKLAIIGCTGTVGDAILQVLQQQKVFVETLIPVASQRSVGKFVKFNNKNIKVVSIEEALMLKPDYAIFSSSKDASITYAKKFTDQNCIVIDNSSAWRMCDDVPLVVPEINIQTAYNHKLIANPNCSTIIMLMALYNLHKAFTAKRLVISTYQSVSGSGSNGINQLLAERKGKKYNYPAYPYKIDMNVIPQGGNFTDNGYTEEEMKLVNETRKILGDNNINITATVVRVPVIGGHSISLNAEFEKDINLKEVFSILKHTEGLHILDGIHNNKYPMPILVQNKDKVFVGRIRKDFSRDNCINMWICGDNLRKGAATNAVQILQSMVKINSLK